MLSIYFQCKYFTYHYGPSCVRDYDLNKTKLILHYLKMLINKFQLFWQNEVWEEDFKRFFFIYSYVKINLPLWPYSTPEDRDLEKKPENLHHLKMLPHKFRIFFPNWFWEDFFEKPTFFQWIFIISSLKNAVPFVLRILNPTSPKNTLGQVLLNLAKWFWWRSQECLKTNKRTDWRTEAEQKFIRKAQLSFQLSLG